MWHGLLLGYGALRPGVEDIFSLVLDFPPLGLSPQTVFPEIPITLEIIYELTYTYLLNCNVNV